MGPRRTHNTTVVLLMGVSIGCSFCIIFHPSFQFTFGRMSLFANGPLYSLFGCHIMTWPCFLRTGAGLINLATLFRKLKESAENVCGRGKPDVCGRKLSALTSW
jgi:hypothetical protein